MLSYFLHRMRGGSKLPMDEKSVQWRIDHDTS